LELIKPVSPSISPRALHKFLVNIVRLCSLYFPRLIKLDQFIRLGQTGYRSIMKNLTRTADYLSDALRALGFIIMSQGGGKGLPLVAFRLDPKHKHHFDEFAIAHQLRERGWVVPAYTMAPNAGKLKMMRVVVREDFSRSRCDSLVTDINQAVNTLKSMDKQRIEEHLNHVKKNSHVAKGTGRHTHHHYKNEKHSLQGKTGKTHAVC
jgi:glutamate decarboxylase